MTRRHWPNSLPAIALAVLCAVLLLLAMRGPPAWTPPDPGDAASRLGSLSGETEAQAAFPAPPAQVIDTVLARNLFSIDRTPPPERFRSTADEQANSSDLQLVGALLAEDRSVAILRHGPSGETVHLPLGESFSGWQLVALDSTKAVMRRDGEQISLILAFVEGEAAPVRVRPSLPIEPRRGDLEGRPVRAERPSLFQIQREREATGSGPPQRRQ